MSDLTPEDRQRIYQEEKARLEAQNVEAGVVPTKMRRRIYLEEKARLEARQQLGVPAKEGQTALTRLRGCADLLLFGVALVVIGLLLATLGILMRF